METYSKTVIWTHFLGGKEAVTARGVSARDAIMQAVDAAAWHGWQPPRWWQFWRRGDTAMRDLKLE